MITEYFNIDPLTPQGCAVALLCGFIIGLERQIKGKPSGIRTSILVCLGAYTFVVLAGTLGGADDKARVLGQVVTGIGFLGAGLMMTKDGGVRGVTSAATIWVLASIGCLTGFERYGAALMLTLLVLLILIGINYIEKTFQKLRRGVHRDEGD